MNIDRKAYLKELNKKFIPLLRESEFKGSGATFRRLNGPVVHVFNVQGSSGRGGCYINLGAHLLLLEDSHGDKKDPIKIDEASCLFRTRFEPDEKQFEVNGLWPYGGSEREMDLSISHMVVKWKREGQSFFEKYQDYPDSFMAVVRDIDPKEAHPGRLADFVELAIILNEYDRAQIFIGEALERCPERATGLLSRLQVQKNRVLDILA